ncbi:porin family protein [Chitinophaga sp. MM2321]|uniref:porin family protein n=1 Tax=Chitinophaga sp. MM2321 TaxID=3137178 RepID=UPI0032D5A77C
MKATLHLLTPFITLFLLVPFYTQAQVDLGVKAGLSIPNLTSGSSANPINSGYSSRLGPDFAIHAEFHLTDQFSIQPQLEYSSQGGQKDGKQAFSVPAEMVPLFPPGQVPQYLYANYKSTAKINYLMLPVLAKYHIPLGGNWDFYVAAGPFVSIVVSAKNVTSGTSSIYLDEQQTQALPTGPQSFDKEVDIKDELHKANWGVDGHVGFAYKFGRSSVFIEGGGNYGFVNIQKNDVNGKNNTGAGVVVLGYAFQICQRK